MKYFVVKYTGPFGFIKPWTAVRDGGKPEDLHTQSQQFLTQSMIEGIEKKLFPELILNKNSYGRVLKIKRYRLNYQGLSVQLEVTWAKKRKRYKKKGKWENNNSFINRGVMINPHLYLAFGNKEDAKKAFEQTICLARNEDLLYPIEQFEMSEEEFNKIDGFELIFTNSEEGFKVGYNRFDNASEMFGRLEVYGNPIRE